MDSLLLTFECGVCRKLFEAAGDLEEWTSSIYGPCREYRAPCPSCGASAKEFRAPVSSAAEPAPCGDERGCGSCPSGQVPCGI